MPQEKDKNKNYAGLFIPSGLIIGMGIGMLLGQTSAGLLIGLGAGFILFAIIGLYKK